MTVVETKVKTKAEVKRRKGTSEAIKLRQIKLPVLSRIHGDFADYKDITINYPFLMLYLRVISLSGLSVKKLFSLLGVAGGIIGASYKVFRKLDILVNKWGYKSTKALRYLADSTKHRELRGLLFRLAYAISIGISIKDFAKLEYQKYVLQEDREISHKMDRLKVFSDAYSALLNANILIAVITVMIGMTFGAAEPVSTLISVLTVIVASIVGILLLFKITVPPRGSIIYTNKPIPKHLKTLFFISKPALVIATVTIIVPTVVSIQLVSQLPESYLQLYILLNYVLPVTYGVAGLMLFVIGFIGMRRAKAIDNLDQLYMIFIKTLGEATAVAGSLREGVRRIIHNDYKELNPYIRRLFNRLKTGIRAEISWKVFAIETGSNIIYRYTAVYVNALKVGSPAIEMSNIIYDAVNREIVIRNRRISVANYLKGMILPLQGVFTAIFTLIATLTSIFYKISRLVSGYISILSIPNPLFIVLFLFLGSLILTFGNSIAIYILRGDSIFTLLYYLGLLSIISSFTYLILSHGLSWIFNMFIGFERGLREIGI